jgi:hypothetical protein
MMEDGRWKMEVNRELEGEEKSFSEKKAEGDSKYSEKEPRLEGITLRCLPTCIRTEGMSHVLCYYYTFFYTCKMY